MSIERLVREALEDSVKALPCPEPDLEQLVTAGRAMRRRRVGVVAGLAAAAVLVLVLAGLSFALAGRSGRALEPVPANPTYQRDRSGRRSGRSCSNGSTPSRPARRRPRPYWHDGILYVNGVQIPAPYNAVDIEVVGDAVLVGGYESEAKDGAAPTAWALVRGDRLEPLPVPAGAHPPGLSVDGRIAYWVEHQGTRALWSSSPGTPRRTPRCPHASLQRGADGWDGLELLGVDAAGSGYWKASLSDPYLTRWDVRADTIHPTDLAYDTMQAPEEVDGFFPWMHWRTSTAPRTAPRRSSPTPSRGTRRLTAASTSCGCDRSGRTIRSIPRTSSRCRSPKPTPATRFPWAKVDGYWMWWESNESVLLTLDGDVHTYLVRCSTTGGSCQRVVDLGTDTPERDSLHPRVGSQLGIRPRRPGVAVEPPRRHQRRRRGR